METAPAICFIAIAVSVPLLCGYIIGFMFGKNINQASVEKFYQSLESPGIHDEYDDDWDDDNEDTLTDWLWGYHPEIITQLNQYHKNSKEFLSQSTKTTSDLKALRAQAVFIVKLILDVLDSERKQIGEESEAQKNPE